ncbi:MAG: electron transport complex subunit RsxE [Gammaproteobacteria bacterium]|nr:electron transport complex subunit RsxE [Gammaproteobacteria bacterium]
MSNAATFSRAMLERNPAWAQLLGLCPLLAVSTSVVNALALALASTFVLLGTNVCISSIRRWIPEYARLPCFVLIIATFTTCSVLLMQAFAFEMYLRIALFVQIIVTNCMILGRVEAFASKQPVARAVMDAAGTAAGFAIALIVMGAARELIGKGTLFAGMELLFPGAHGWEWSVTSNSRGLLLASLPPGAFIIAGLLLGSANALFRRAGDPSDDPTHAETNQ